ncbi:MAG: protein-export membrane protein SecF [Ignavibacteria bacterium RBG_13_36_8]|nr:MAG: protein-export membrane protein SecF [Ignavibacteria bacterium RBG_13_36_8]
MRLFENLNVDFLGKRKLFYVVSASIIFLGIISLFLRGLALGIDFKGGSEVALQFQNPVEIGEIRDEVNKIGLGNVEVKTFGGATGVIIRSEIQEIPRNIFPRVISTIDKLIDRYYPGVQKNIIDSTYSSITYSLPSPEIADDLNTKLFDAGFQTSKLSEEPTNTGLMIRIGISDWIKENLIEKYASNPFNVLKEDKVGPKIGEELKRDTIIAIALALIVILIYLGFRFKWTFAVGAVAALFHDVMITLGLFSLLYGVFPWLNLEVSLAIVAAFLTLIGYSINDTVVVFDRVREYMKIHKTLELKETMNKAINRTMSRTIITGFTTLLTVLVLLIFGGEVLRGFAFVLFIGIIVGTYSSIFVASAFVLEYALKSKKKLQF